MKLVEGGSLAHQAPPTVRERIAVMVKVARAVHHAHQCQRDAEQRERTTMDESAPGSVASELRRAPRTPDGTGVPVVQAGIAAEQAVSIGGGLEVLGLF